MSFPSVGSPSSIKEVPALTIMEGRLHVIEELTIALLPPGISKPIFPGMFPGFSGGTSGKEPGCQCRRHKRCGFDPWVGKIPLEEGMATHSSTLAWRIPWTEEADGLQSMRLQSQTRLTD